MIYKLVSDSNLARFIVLINNCLRDGYELQGELVVTELKEASNVRTSLVYSQALILKEKTDK